MKTRLKIFTATAILGLLLSACATHAPIYTVEPTEDGKSWECTHNCPEKKEDKGSIIDQAVSLYEQSSFIGKITKYLK